MTRNTLGLALLGILALLAASTAAGQPTITNTTRSTTHATVQEAVESALDGDVIEIGVGTLDEAPVSILNRALTLRGQGPGQTIFDVDFGSDRVFLIGGDADVVLEGFGLRNGRVTGDDGPGGGLKVIDDATVTVRRCRFEGNDAGPGPGGAIFSDSSGDLFIEACEFRGNIGSGTSEVFAFNEGIASFTNCLFAAEAGAAYAVAAGSPEVRFVNCTFAGSVGSGYLLTEQGQVLVVNCVASGAAPFASSLPSDATLSRCVFPGAPEDSIDGEPLFVDPAADDFRLAPHSLGIDAADSDVYSTYSSSPVDLAGSPREADDPDLANFGIGAAGTLDAGAYERQPSGIRALVQPVSAEAADGDPPVAFTFRATPAASYLWSRDGVALSDGGGYAGTTTKTLLVTPSASTAGIYTCLVTGPQGESLTSRAVGLAVVPGLGFCLSDINRDGMLDLSDINAFTIGFLRGCDG